jgi:outer membrane lipoprotein-sorting protein
LIALPWRFQPAAASPIRRFLLLTPLAIALAGCATVTPPAPAPQLPAPKWESAKLTESLNQRREQIRTLRALAHVNYTGPEGKQSFDEAVLVQRPDRLRLETLSMLGAILIVTANKQEIIGYHPREGIMVRGQSSKANLLRYTQIPLELDEITALLAGLPPVDGSKPAQQDGNTLVFSANGVKKDAVSFESQQPVPTQWQRFNSSGAVELSASFSDYVNTAAGLFPGKINIEAPLQKKKLEIRFQEPELNASIQADQFSQSKPAHVQEVPIEAIGS